MTDSDSQEVGTPDWQSESWLRFGAPVPQQWDENGRPTLAAMSLRPGEDGLSGNLRQAMNALGLDATVVLEGREGYGLFAVPVPDIEAAGCEVVLRTIEAPQRREDSTHAIVPKPHVDKPTWMEIRSRLLAVAEVITVPMFSG